MIRVIVTDDHAMLRKGLKRLLEDDTRIQQVDEAENGAQLITMLQNKTYDIIILDISLPGQNGLEILKQIKSIYPGIPVLILSMHPENQYALRAIKAGAAGYLTKDKAPEELLQAIEQIIQGHTFINTYVADLLVNEMNNDCDFPHQRLSDREFEIFCLIAAGYGITEIGKRLNLSKKTIGTYRSRIMQKMNFTKNPEIMKYAIEHNIECT